jgi:hypothetical protein
MDRMHNNLKFLKPNNVQFTKIDIQSICNKKVHSKNSKSTRYYVPSRLTNRKKYAKTFFWIYMFLFCMHVIFLHSINIFIILSGLFVLINQQRFETQGWIIMFLVYTLYSFFILLCVSIVLFSK